MAFTRTFWRSAVLVLLLSTFGAAQQTISSTRDPQAVALVQAAVNAMGGPNAAQGIRTVVASGGTDTAFHSFLWKDDFSGGRHEFRRELTDGTNTRLLVSGHGTPAAAFDNKARKLRKHVAYAIWPLHLPIVMLYDVLQNTNYSLTLGPQAVIGNHTCFQLLAKDESGPVEAALSVQQWYIDATTGIPVRLQHRVADAMAVESYETAKVDYSDFRSVNGVLIPFQLVTSQSGKKTGTVTLTSVVVNSPISSSDFDIPGVR
jgi:hypothetical protein